MGRKPSRSGARDGSKHLKRTVHCVYPGCDKKFGRKDHLRRHVATHERASPNSSPLSQSNAPPDVDQVFHTDQSIPDDGVGELTNHNRVPESSTVYPLNALSDNNGGSEPGPLALSAIDRFPRLNEPYVDRQEETEISAFDWDAFLASIINPPISPVDLVFYGHADTALTSTSPLFHITTSRLIDPNHINAQTRARLAEAFPDVFGLLAANMIHDEALSNALRAYWDKFDPQFPVVHRPSFDPQTSSVERLGVMLTIGQYHLSTERNSLANLVPIVRGRLLVKLSPDMQLIDLQTLLLCHIYDEWMSTSSAHYQAQCFSSTLIAVLRRRSLLVRHDWPDLGSPNHPSEYWRAWIEDESAVRLAYGLMVIDSGLSVFWGQVSSRRHSALLLQLRLPESTSLWSANDATAWQTIMFSKAREHPDHASIDQNFLPAFHVPYEAGRPLPGYSQLLKAVLEGHGDQDECKPLWNRLLILHGLNMLVWDIKLHGSVSLIGRVSFNWRQSLHYAMLKIDDLIPEVTESPSACRHFRDSIMLSMVSLFADITNVQILAGAESVGGTTIGRGQRQSAETKLNSWILSTEGKAAVFHASTYLREIYVSHLFSDPGVMTAWVVYICSIVCWVVSSLKQPLQKISRRPPQQLIIPRAVSFLQQLSEHRTAGSVDVNVGLYSMLSAALFYLQERAGRWGVGLDAANVLSTLAEGMLETSSSELT